MNTNTTINTARDTPLGMAVNEPGKESEKLSPASPAVRTFADLNDPSLLSSKPLTMTTESSKTGKIIEPPKTFPDVLRDIVSDHEIDDTIGWLPNGRQFVIRNRKKLITDVLPRFLDKRIKFTSFTKKLSRWDFTRLSSTSHGDVFFNKFFQRDQPELRVKMRCRCERTSTPSPSWVLPAILNKAVISPTTTTTTATQQVQPQQVQATQQVVQQQHVQQQQQFFLPGTAGIRGTLSPLSASATRRTISSSSPSSSSAQNNNNSTALLSAAVLDNAAVVQKARIQRMLSAARAQEWAVASARMAAATGSYDNAIAQLAQAYALAANNNNNNNNNNHLSPSSFARPPPTPNNSNNNNSNNNNNNNNNNAGGLRRL